MTDNSNKDDLLTRWLNQRENTDRGMSQNSPIVNVSRQQNPPKSSQNTSSTPNDVIKRIASPHLTGKLADHLEHQKPRQIDTPQHAFTSPDTSWVAEDTPTRAALTMALILTSHLTRFANTQISTTHLNKARDTLLKTFHANDAVYLEVEAYELMQWFAAAMNPNWLPNVAKTTTESIAETSEAALIQIIVSAMHYQHDLDMKYYTSSSGKFSQRRITPIEITAEKYLIAYCHLRQEERVFRLSRIVTLCPADNASDEAPKLCYPSPSDTALPPLPDTPSTEFSIPNSKLASHGKNIKSDQIKPTKSDQIKPTYSEKNKRTSKTAQSKPINSEKKQKNKQKQIKTPTLFDFESTQTSKNNTTSHTKNSNQLRLPGFDENK